MKFKVKLSTFIDHVDLSAHDCITLTTSFGKVAIEKRDDVDIQFGDGVTLAGEIDIMTQDVTLGDEPVVLYRDMRPYATVPRIF